MFSQTQHRLRLRRAENRFRDGNEFLVQHAMQDIVERLSLVARDFDEAVLLFARTSAAGDLLRDCGKVGRLLRIEEDQHIGHADRLATPDQLGLPDAGADLVAAPLCLHWSNDLAGTLAQICRGLRPDGLFLGSLPGPGTLSELRQSLLQAESDVYGGAGVRVDPFTDIRDAGSLLQRAGFSLPVVDQSTLVVRYDTALDLIRDLRNFGAGLQLLNDENPRLNRDVLARMVELYARHHSDGDGRIRASFNLISLSAWAPHESQQKPLKPGSATMRLADALQVSKSRPKS